MRSEDRRRPISVRYFLRDWSTIRDSLVSPSASAHTDLPLLISAGNALFWLIIVVSGSFVVLSLAYFVGTSTFLEKDYTELASRFGDTFNILNSLLSGLALGVIALSLFLQRSDLKATLEQMRKTSDELSKQNEHLQHEQDRGVQEFAATFASDNFRDARKRAYKLRAPFFLCHAFRTWLADQWVTSQADFPSNEAMLEAYREWSEDAVSKDEPVWEISSLIEYYSRLYHHCKLLFDTNPRWSIESAETLTNQYSWQYWRGMLLLLAYEASVLYDNNVGNAKDPRAKEQFAKPPWIADLAALDLLAGYVTYEPNTHPREWKYKRAGVTIEFEMDLILRPSDRTRIGELREKYARKPSTDPGNSEASLTCSGASAS